ncbi:hypothetical protein ACFQJC_08675 [Haloferax namakaokahaiae]|uniref:Sulfatase n=1 Tax=Haloferax namakaokahaiae TaxID=1748331 RepID=A0ABD5ZEE1_9EURY
MESNLREWSSEMRQRFDRQGWRGLLYVVFTIYLMFWYAVTSRFEPGENIYENEWDLLIVLDACRVDTLKEVASEYDFIGEVETKWSVGSQSDEWMAKTFTSKWQSEISRTRYITGNGHTKLIFGDRDFPPQNNTTPFDFSRWDIVTRDTFYELDEVWEKNHDPQYGVVLPHSVTDRAIVAGRTGGHDRMLLHYMQPHLPYIGNAIKDGRDPNEVEKHGYELLRTGDASRDIVIELYRETLRYVLDSVEVLLENTDAERVVITADHGEAFGEGAAYGHPEGFPHPIVKRVPWVETTASDSKSYKPDIEDVHTESIAVEDHLKDLGYM